MHREIKIIKKGADGYLKEAGQGGGGKLEKVEKKKPSERELAENFQRQVKESQAELKRKYDEEADQLRESNFNIKRR